MYISLKVGISGYKLNMCIQILFKKTFFLRCKLRLRDSQHSTLAFLWKPKISIIDPKNAYTKINGYV